MRVYFHTDKSATRDGFTVSYKEGKGDFFDVNTTVLCISKVAKDQGMTAKGR